MEPEDRAYRLQIASNLLGRAKALLGELEHPALGDVERLIERLREEQAELQRRNPK